MSLLEQWRKLAYQAEKNEKQSQEFWNQYFALEKGIYEQILAGKDAVSGTIKELADKYSVELLIMVGFLDGINDSLKKANPIETMEEDTVVSLDFDDEKLYYNMVGAKANWLYELPQWEGRLTTEKRKELYKAQRSSTTVVNDKKIGRNDKCPCGSGKKYKQCCGR